MLNQLFVLNMALLLCKILVILVKGVSKMSLTINWTMAGWIMAGIVFWVVLVILICRLVWRPMAWPALARALADVGKFFIRIPHNAIMCLTKDRNAWKYFVSVVQARHEEFKLYCFMSNLRQFAHLRPGTPVIINGQDMDYEDSKKEKRHDKGFVEYCREKHEGVISGTTDLLGLMSDPRLSKILEPIPDELFELVNHREMRRWLTDDSRMFYLIKEGQGSLTAIPPWWIVDVKVFAAYKKAGEEFENPEPKHSVKLERVVLLFPPESKKSKAVAGLYVEDQISGDPATLAFQITGEHEPALPDLVLWATEHPVSAAFWLIVPVLGRVIRALSLRDFAKSTEIQGELKEKTAKVGSVEKASGKVMEGITSKLLREVDRRFRIAIGQVREFPAGLSKEDEEQARKWFPEGLIPTYDYEVNAGNQAPRKELFEALGFQKTPLLDASDNIKWKKRYLDRTSVIGKIYHEMGYFNSYYLSDMELTDANVYTQLQAWLVAEYKKRERIELAEATQIEEQARRTGEASGIEAKLKVFKRLAGLEGRDLAEIGTLLEYYETLRTLPQDKARTLFFNMGQSSGAGAGENSSPFKQMLWDFLSQSPDALAALRALVQKKPEAAGGSEEKAGGKAKEGAGKKGGREKRR